MIFRLLITILSLGLVSFSQEIVPNYYKLSEADMQQAYLEVAQGFASAKTADGAAQFISSDNDDLFQEAFEEYHRDKEIVLEEKCHVFTHNMNQYAMVRNTASTDTDKQEFLFLIWNGEMEAPKIQWKASYGWGAMSWEQFLEEKPEISIEMRLTVEKGRYYNYQFSDESVWQCLKFYLDITEETMYAYIRRDNPKYKKLLSEIYKKRACSITAKLAYPEGEKQPTQVELVEMLSETWFDIKK